MKLVNLAISIVIIATLAACSSCQEPAIALRSPLTIIDTAPQPTTPQSASPYYPLTVQREK